jgi:hypothetical protein
MAAILVNTLLASGEEVVFDIQPALMQLYVDRMPVRD